MMIQHLKAVWAFRYFWMALVQMDLRQRYRKSVLGIGWSVLHPVAMSAVFCVVFSTIMRVGDGDWGKVGYSANWRGYAAYLLTGLAVWDFIRNSTITGCRALMANESYIRQCPLPYGIYPLRVVMGTGIHFLITMGVVLTLTCLLRGSAAPLAMLWAVVPAMALVFFFCWATATLAAFATVYFHDTAHLAEVGAQLFFFLTPIMYSRAMLDKEGIGFMADLNPVVVFLEMIRTPLVYGTVPDAAIYVQGVALTVAAVGLAFGTIGWLQKKVIFQL